MGKACPGRPRGEHQMISDFVAHRRARTNVTRVFMMAATAALLASSQAAAAPPSADAIATVTPQASDSLLGSTDLNIGPSLPAAPATVAVYTFSVADGGEVKQRLPIQVCSSAHANTWVFYDISGNPAG